jgi:hypothetical protein
VCIDASAAILAWYTVSEMLVHGGGGGVVVWLGWVLVRLSASGRVVWQAVPGGPVVVAMVWA